LHGDDALGEEFGGEHGGGRVLKGRGIGYRRGARAVSIDEGGDARAQAARLARATVAVVNNRALMGMSAAAGQPSIPPGCFQEGPWHARQDKRSVRADASVSQIWWPDGSRRTGRCV
jgi:hypothetical protein